MTSAHTLPIAQTAPPTPPSPTAHGTRLTRRPVNGRCLTSTLWVSRLCLAAGIMAAALTTALVRAVAPLPPLPLGLMPRTDVSERSAPATVAPIVRPGSIRVHGDWLIEVFNRNGTLATRRAFQNALTTNGAGLLARLGARSNSVGRWAVTVSDGSFGALCQSSVGFGVSLPGVCASVEPGTGSIGPIASAYAEHQTLAISVPETGPNAGKFVLKGSVTIAKTGKISSVGTLNRVCAATSAPATPCQTGTLESFTSKTLNPDVPVALDQQVAITVVISFS